jgi:hypothetical protein
VAIGIPGRTQQGNRMNVNNQQVHVLKGHGFSRAARNPMEIPGFSP